MRHGKEGAWVQSAMLEASVSKRAKTSPLERVERSQPTATKLPKKFGRSTTAVARERVNGIPTSSSAETIG